MYYVIGLAVVVVALAAALVLLKHLGAAQRAVGTQELPYRRKDYLLSKAEHSFYQVLLRAVGDRWRVFAKVRLLDLVWLPRGTANAQSHRNRVQSKHVDFVLCSPAGCVPALVIELDDASHEREDRAARDRFVDRVFEAAGIPVLHVPARRTYAVAELARRIESLTQGASDAGEKATATTQR